MATLADAWILDSAVRTWLVARMALSSPMATGADKSTKALALIFRGLADELNRGRSKSIYISPLTIHVLGWRFQGLRPSN